MCVIFVADEKRPTLEMVEGGWDQNPAGAGAAWREGGFARWEKGLTLERVKELSQKLPLPFILHFRIPSVGGKRDSLCHPFPITKDVPLNLSGKTKGELLFHNGHWGRWRESILETVRTTPNFKIPMGKWSDTRAMALYAATYGIGVLEFVDEKTVVFGPKELEIFGSGWSQVNDVWVSNRFFENGSRRVGYQYTTPPASMGGNSSGAASTKREPIILTPHVPHVGTFAGTAVIVGRKALAAGDVQGTGGSSAETPFDRAKRLFREKKLSKKQLKKAMKAMKNGKPVQILEAPAIVH